jgi:hypothetical protein
MFYFLPTHHRRGVQTGRRRSRTTLARLCTNKHPIYMHRARTARFELQRSLQIGTNVINNGGRANCDEITDFMRSVRALSNTYFVFNRPN